MRNILFIILLFFSAKACCQVSDYKEKHRPQFHFSPPAHWMNDPNGMVYYKGDYHLFYQYYPDSTVWGPMHWGHAVTADLIHWKHLPVALYPDSLGYIFSGSVVVDKNNTSGFQKGNEKPLVALFTYHDIKKEKAGASDFQTQGLAYSLDKGRTWKKYSGNPVIKNNGVKDFRDPKVFWHERTKHWIMTLAAADHVEFYRSENLKEWQPAGSFGKNDGNHGGVWECPDLIEIKVDDSNQSKWLLLVSVGTGAPNGGSGTQYFIGDFDGKTFINDSPKEEVRWADYGPDDYAGVTWSNTGKSQPVFLGWMSNWNYAQAVPTKVWRSAMTIPRELKLKNTIKGVRLFCRPVQALKRLRIEERPIASFKKIHYQGGLYELSLNFSVNKNDTADFGVVFSNSLDQSIKIGYNKSMNLFYIDRGNAGPNSFSTQFTAKSTAQRILQSDSITMHLYIDHSSVELFADDGSVVMTSVFFPGRFFSEVQLFRQNDNTKLNSGKLYILKSVWH